MTATKHAMVLMHQVGYDFEETLCELAESYSLREIARMHARQLSKLEIPSNACNACVMVIEANR